MNNEFTFSPIDERDYVYCGSVLELPSKYIVKTSKIKHQGCTNHCTSFATSSLLEAKNAKIYGVMDELSTLFIMKNNKDNDSNPSITGSYTRVSAEMGCKYGSCLETDYPFINSNTNKFPQAPKVLYDRAKKYSADAYGQVSMDVNRIKEAIYQNDGVLFAIEIFPSYSETIEGYIRPSKGEVAKGGHCIFVCGYDDNMTYDFKDGKGIRKGFFVLQESYGENNAETYRGYKYLAYDAVKTGDWNGRLSSEKLIREIWTITDRDNLQAPNYHKNNQIPIKPNIEIKLKLGSKIANVNGKETILNEPPALVNTTTFLPLRFCGEAFGCDVNYISSEKRIEVTHNKKGMFIEMRVGSCTILSSNKLTGRYETIYSVEPIFVNGGSSMIPIRAFANAFGCSVDYNSKTKEIAILEG